MQEAQAGLALQEEDRAHRLPHPMSRWVAQSIPRPALNEARLQREEQALVLAEVPPEEATKDAGEHLAIIEGQCSRPKATQGAPNILCQIFSPV